MIAIGTPESQSCALISLNSLQRKAKFQKSPLRVCCLRDVGNHCLPPFFRQNIVSDATSWHEASLAPVWLQQSTQYLDTCIPGYLDTWIPGYLDTWIHGYLDTWMPRYLDSWMPGCNKLCTWRSLSQEEKQERKGECGHAENQCSVISITLHLSF